MLVAAGNAPEGVDGVVAHPGGTTHTGKPLENPNEDHEWSHLGDQVSPSTSEPLFANRTKASVEGALGTRVAATWLVPTSFFTANSSTMALLPGKEVLQGRLAGGEFIHSPNVGALPVDGVGEVAAAFLFGMALLISLLVTSGRLFT